MTSEEFSTQFINIRESGRNLWANQAGTIDRLAKTLFQKKLIKLNFTETLINFTETRPRYPVNLIYSTDISSQYALYRPKVTKFVLHFCENTIQITIVVYFRESGDLRMAE